MRDSIGQLIEGPSGDAGQLALDLVFRYFQESNDWPEFDIIDRELYSNGVRSEDAFAQLPEGLLLGPDRTRWNRLPLPEAPLQLTLKGAICCSDGLAAVEVDCAVVLTCLAVEVDRNWKPTAERREPLLQAQSALAFLAERQALLPAAMSKFIDELEASSKVEDPDLSVEDALERAADTILALVLRGAKLLAREPQFKGSSLGSDYEWELRFDRAIRPFAGVESIDDYWRVRCDVVLNKNVSTMVEALAPAPESDQGEARTAHGESDSRWSVECALHAEIVDAVADRYATGHLADAVQKAFQAVEYRVQRLLDSSEVGGRLMGNAFGGATPPLMLARAEGASQASEQDGFRDLFRGAMSGLRNPRAHGPHYAEEEAEVLEMLAFASLLMRRLDLAEQRLATPAEVEASVE